MRLPSSIRKYIRKEKARFRREVADLPQRRKLVDELYQKFVRKEQPSVAKEEKKTLPVSQPEEPLVVAKEK